ncbi:MAG: YdcF family protein [Kiritimatiellae bacterium]|nr:YdcF family protein [Kiritimatiellia bacterium]
MNLINKLLFLGVNPLVLTFVGMFVSFITKKRCRWIIVGTFVWLWFWSAGIAGRIIALPLEREWPVVAAEDQPTADAIVLLGGGITPQREGFPTPDLKQGADRVWYAAKLYNAGKAPIVIPSNINAERCDNILLMDLGVPEAAIKLETSARNTEENAKLVAAMLGQGKKILLVTSAWHMRRSVFMFQKYAPGIEILPAATDYETLTGYDSNLSWRDFVPDAGALASNVAMFKEIIGYWGYRLFRR